MFAPLWLGRIKEHIQYTPVNNSDKKPYLVFECPWFLSPANNVEQTSVDETTVQTKFMEGRLDISTKKNNLQFKNVDILTHFVSYKLFMTIVNIIL